MTQKNYFIAVMLLLSGMYSKDGLTDPLDKGVRSEAGVSNSPGSWGMMIPAALAGVIWNLQVEWNGQSFSVASWQSYLQQWTNWEWAAWAAPYKWRGVLYSQQEWFEWYEANDQWSGLSWTLHFLEMSPLRVLRMIRQKMDRIWSRM